MTNDRGPDSSDDRLLAMARRLPTELTPSRDLWPEIARRIGEEEAAAQRGGRWRRLYAVAAALALVTLSSLVTLWVTDEPVERVVVVPAGGGVAVPAGTASFGAGIALGPRYERARRELTRDLERELQALPTETQELVNRNLEQIRAAAAEINRELSRDPNNVLLQQLLLAAYQDELAVLMDVNRMVQTLPVRNEI